MTKTFISLVGNSEGRYVFNVDDIIGWTPDNGDSSITRIYLKGELIVRSFESTKQFEHRYKKAVNNQIYIQED